MISSTQDDLLFELKQIDIDKPVRKLYDYYYEGTVAQICAAGGTIDDGSDIFQESVLILIEKLKTGQFRGDSSIKTFLSGIARNLWLFELRTRSRRKNREQLYMVGESTALTAEESFFTKGNTEDLTAVFSEIGDTCKKILTGFYYEDKSMKDMLAEFSYENEQVLRNKKSKCMKKLKEFLQANTTLLKNLKPISFYES
jgi:RNA polymerase sigma factor (sigma-70 family)